MLKSSVYNESFHLEIFEIGYAGNAGPGNDYSLRIFFYNFVELKKSRHGYYLIFATVAAFFAKQTTIFLIPLFFLYLLFTKKLNRFLNKKVVLIGLVLFLLLLPLIAFTLKFGKINILQSIGNMGTEYNLLSSKRWLKYPGYLPRVLTLPVLLLSITSIFVVFRKRGHQKTMIFLSWIGAFYLVFSLIHVKEDRYAFFLIPPFTLFAALILDAIPYKVKKRSVRTSAMVAICLYQFFLSFSLKTPFVYGYEEAAQYILDKQENRVFFQGSGIGSGNFIFHIRRKDNERKMIIFRGDKILASSAIEAHWFLVEHVSTIEETYAALEAYGVKYFVIEKNADYGVNSYRMLREVLKSDRFTLVKEIRLNTDIFELQNEILLIYQLNKEPHTKRDLIHMRLPIIGSEITVPIEHLSKFYTPSETSSFSSAP